MIVRTTLDSEIETHGYVTRSQQIESGRKDSRTRWVGYTKELTPLYAYVAPISVRSLSSVGGKRVRR